MTFCENLKKLRKQAGMSQEKLAERLGVSRQAVTKWETDGGVPDIENVVAIANLFGVSVDSLLRAESLPRQTEFAYESVVECDVDEEKRFDIDLGGVKAATLLGYDGEKICVRLVSDTLKTLQSNVKVKFDDGRKHMDVQINRKNGVTATTTKQAVSVFVTLPLKYVSRVELAACAETIEMRNIACPHAELNIKAQKLVTDGATERLEIDCNEDMEIRCKSLDGAIELNQISATSKLYLPKDVPFEAVTKGFGNSIIFQDGLQPTNAENTIELNGMKSELTICAAKD